MWHESLAFTMGMIVLLGNARAQGTDEINAETTARTNGEVLQEQIKMHRAGLEAREERIDAELAALDRDALHDGHWVREWAGSYETGDGLGMNVSIKVAPGSGVTYTWRGCLGLYDMNHGDIVESFDDGLRLKLAFDPDVDYTDFMDDRLYFVRWGPRKYLVPERQMLDLVNNYNQGGYTRRSMWDIPRRDDAARRSWSEKSPEGVPLLPLKWAQKLLREPIELTITASEAVPPRRVTGGVGAWEWKLEFSGGEANGVYEGMQFRLGGTFGSGQVTITEVERDRCHGEFVCYASRHEVEAPAVGERVVLPEH